MAETAFKLGSAVKNGVIRFVSVSQIESFDPSVYGGCNRRWWFRRVARSKEDQGAPAELGEKLHKQIEHYLKHGDPVVLGPIVKAGFRFLPRPGPDLKLEWEFGQLFGENVVSPLYLSDVPVIGKADCGHARGEWVDDDGQVNVEPGMVEIIDWKTTKRIDDEVDEHGYVTYQGLAKEANVLANTHQMRAYAALAVTEWPNAKTVRLGHGYFQTGRVRHASKRSKAVDASEAIDRFLSSSPLVAKMKDVAKAAKVTDVDPNYVACRAFGGCPHRESCPRSALASVSGFSQIRATKDVEIGEHVSLIKKSKAVAPEVATEIEKLKAEEAGIAPPDEPAPKDVAVIDESVNNVPAAYGGADGSSCAAGGQQVELKDDSRLYNCPCGAVVKVKPRQLGDGKNYAMIPTHIVGERPVKKVSAPKKAEEKSEIDMSEYQAIKTNGFVLFLDATADNVKLDRLETYAEEAAKTLAEAEGAVDVRCAPERSALAFGKWKGALSAVIKSNPPPAGYYAVASTSELGMVAFEALLSAADMVVRAGR